MEAWRRSSGPWWGRDINEGRCAPVAQLDRARLGERLESPQACRAEEPALAPTVENKTLAKMASAGPKASQGRQHFLYLRPLPQGHGSLRPGAAAARGRRCSDLRWASQSAKPRMKRKRPLSSSWIEGRALNRVSVICSTALADDPGAVDSSLWWPVRRL